MRLRYRRFFTILPVVCLLYLPHLHWLCWSCLVKFVGCLFGCVALFNEELLFSCLCSPIISQVSGATPTSSSQSFKTKICSYFYDVFTFLTVSCTAKLLDRRRLIRSVNKKSEKGTGCRKKTSRNSFYCSFIFAWPTFKPAPFATRCTNFISISCLSFGSFK